ncbi:MAG: ribonuclease Y [Phycisphaerae bacterium]|jgi:ribonucrease Y|nr:ribonuclease Y [Phycisphaerae bacterium]MBT6270384.1 ribonuclease Y [Phycisphaerae bacterium]MBT6283071.1 ribonuclease Y [Phycisphaerae bacterium]
MITNIAIGIGSLLLGVAIGWFIFRSLTGGTIRLARREAEQTLASAKTEGESLKQKLELEAERAAKDRRKELESEVSQAQGELKQDQIRLSKREESLEKMMTQLTDRQTKLDDLRVEIDGQTETLEKEKTAFESERRTLRVRLEEVSGMSSDQAKEIILEEVRHDAEHEANDLMQKIVDEATDQARGKSREITLQAIQRYAAEHVAETTVRSVRIPSDDMKGRVIGREGRNIRALEQATGVDILIDDTPGIISVSCFDPIRRAIAGKALEKLVSDGRVHPSRIEEVVENIKSEVQEKIVQKGNDAVMETNIRGLHPKIVEAAGKMHFRTSYGQNVLRHSVEVAFLCQVIADELGLDGELARRCGFLHDIGKAMDHDIDGTHPQIGMDFCRKLGEKSEAVLNAIAGHHGDIPATTPYTPIVMAADAISSARPGARRESMEMYVKRLEQLEALAKEQKGVSESYAIQAGREVRVIVDAKSISDGEAFAMSKRIAARIEEEMTFPGEIKVTVLREIRAEAIAH